MRVQRLLAKLGLGFHYEKEIISQLHMAVGLKIVFLVPAFSLYGCGCKPCPNLLVRSQRRIVRRLLSFYIRERSDVQ